MEIAQKARNVTWRFLLFEQSDLKNHLNNCEFIRFLKKRAKWLFFFSLVFFSHIFQIQAKCESATCAF